MKKHNIKELFKIIGFEIEDQELLQLSLTHKSRLINCPELKSNERLEFLGDSILGFIISQYLFEVFPNDPEGKLSKLKAVIVSKPSLALAARKLKLGNYILIDENEVNDNLKDRDSVLADAFEALIAAIYLSLGLNQTRVFIMESLSDIIKKSPELMVSGDSKTLLQEIVQEKYKSSPKYEIVYAEGMSHNMTFVANVKINDEIMGTGCGKSKKSAQKDAAKKALNTIMDDKK